MITIGTNYLHNRKISREIVLATLYYGKSGKRSFSSLSSRACECRFFSGYVRIYLTINFETNSCYIK